MSILIASGDSFTYGNELRDSNQQPSLFTYPALIAKKINMDYQCVALPGASNSAIRRLTMDACETTLDIGLVMVTWTFCGRYEFKFDNSWEQITAWSILDNVEDIKKEFHVDNPVIFKWHVDKILGDKKLGISQFAKIFYHYVGSFEYWELYTSLSEIVMLQQYLEMKNIPYLFTSVDHGLTNVDHFNDDQTLKTLLKQINFKNWLWFPVNLGFYEWAKENNFPFGTTHPLEESHAEASKIVYEYIRHLGRIS